MFDSCVHSRTEVDHPLNESGRTTERPDEQSALLLRATSGTRAAGFIREDTGGQKETRRENGARAPIRCLGMRIRLQPGQRVRAPRYLGGELHDAVYVGAAPPLVGGPYVGGGQPARVIRVRVRFSDGEKLAVALD
jgi:hypothetical protein